MPINETSPKSLEQVVEEFGRYPLEAFEFVRSGLNQTVQEIHGDVRTKGEESCHVSGRQLAWGLRNYAIQRYGVMAKTVLNHWSVRRTDDFGRIVFAMVESKLMQKTDKDDARDFNGVYDFETVFNPPARPVMASKCVFAL